MAHRSPASCPVAPGQGTRTPFLPGPCLPRSLRPCLCAFRRTFPWSAPQELLPKNSHRFTPQSLFLDLPCTVVFLLHRVQNPGRLTPRDPTTRRSWQTRPSSPAAANHPKASSALPEKFDCRSPPAQRGVRCPLFHHRPTTFFPSQAPSPPPGITLHPTGEQHQVSYAVPYPTAFLCAWLPCDPGLRAPTSIHDLTTPDGRGLTSQSSLSFNSVSLSHSQ